MPEILSSEAKKNGKTRFASSFKSPSGDVAGDNAWNLMSRDCFDIYLRSVPRGRQSGPSKPLAWSVFPFETDRGNETQGSFLAIYTD